MAGTSSVLEERYEVCGSRDAVYEGYTGCLTFRVHDKADSEPYLMHLLPAWAVHYPTEIAARHLAAGIGPAEALSSACLARIHDWGLLTGGAHGRSDLEGSPFLVTEMPVGRSLATLLQMHGALGQRISLEIMRQVLMALRQLHARGIIHGALSPDRVIIDGSLANPNVVVHGLGLRLLDQLATPPGVWPPAGYSHYRAPEEYRGSEPTSKSDIFVWGLILLDCLAGAPGPAGMNALEALLRDPVVELGALPGFPLLRQLLEGCLSADPARRQGDVDAIWARLMTLIHTQVSGSRPAPGGWCLRIEGHGETAEIPLEEREITLGWRPDNVVRLAQQRRCPALLLAKQAGGLYVEELFRPGGATLNGFKFIGRLALAPGDELGVGSYRLIIERR